MGFLEADLHAISVTNFVEAFVEANRESISSAIFGSLIVPPEIDKGNFISMNDSSMILSRKMLYRAGGRRHPWLISTEAGNTC